MKTLFALSLLLFAAQPAQAAFCGKYEVFKEALERKYQEVSVAKGISQGIIIELFGSKKGSFTILAVRPDGHSCIVSSGDGWVNSEKVIEGEKS